MTEVERLAYAYACKSWPGEDDYTPAFDSFVAGYQAAVKDALDKAPEPDEAARREAEADAPPPPALDDLVERLHASSRDDRLQDGMLYRHAAHAIEALRARAESAEARVRELRAAAMNLRLAQRVYMANRGNDALGKAVAKAAEEMDEALAQGGNDG